MPTMVATSRNGPYANPIELTYGRATGQLYILQDVSKLLPSQLASFTHHTER